MKKVLKTLTVFVVCEALIMAPAHATFMDDFYTSAGAAVNVTPAQVRMTGAGNFVTGGSVVWRVPNRGFTPLLWQPPGVKAGCGGIDMYLGSFGFANTAQFVNYLRNVGQNALGLFFKMALKSMSPELEGAITELTAEINKMNALAKSSCQMASSMLTGAGITQQAMDGAMASAKRWAVGDGSASDDATASQNYDANLSASQAKVDAGAVNSGGNAVKKVARNYVWSAMNSGVLTDMPDSKKQIAMSLIGAYGNTIIAASPDQLKPVTQEATIKLVDLVGTSATPNVNLSVLVCDETSECKEPAPAPQLVVPFARIAYNNLVQLRDKIETRAPLTAADDAALQMLGMTSMPVWKVLELTSTPALHWLSDTYIEKFSNVIGYEMAIQFLIQFTQDVEKTMTITGATEDAASVKENYDKIKIQLQKLREEASTVKASIDANVGGMQGMIAEIEHLERTLYFSLSTHLMDNVKFAAR
jgi:conjugative transfer pilus assembly protein TraH